MEHGREYDRRCASAAEAGVASSIIEEGPPVGRIPTHDQPDEDGVVASRHGAALLALDVRDCSIDHGNATVIFLVADAAKPIGVVGRKAAGDGFLLCGENVEDEMRAALERRVHVMLLVDRYEHEGRVERNRRDGARGHPDQLAIRLAAGEHRHAGGKAAEELAELRRLDTAGPAGGSQGGTRTNQRRRPVWTRRAPGPMSPSAARAGRGCSAPAA